MTCTFCQLIQQKANMLYETEKVFAMLSPEPAALGHVVVMPKEHAPILEKVPDFVVSDMFKIANKIGVAVFEGIGAHGTNILVQNGPTAGQKHNHTMIHVVPRSENDNLPLGWTPKAAGDDELASVESSLKEATASVGTFEHEKPKPLELPKEEIVKEEDPRLKALRRIP